MSIHDLRYSVKLIKIAKRDKKKLLKTHCVKDAGAEINPVRVIVTSKPIYISLISWNSPNANWLERAVIGRY